MSKLPEEFQNKERLYKNVILFVAVIVMVVYHFEKIIEVLQWLISVVLPFIVGGILAFILDVIAKGIYNFITGTLKRKERTVFKVFSNIAAILIILIVLLMFVTLILPQLFSSIQSILLNLPFAINNLYQWALHATKKWDMVHSWLLDLNANVFDDQNLLDSINSIFSSGSDGQIGSLFSSIVTLITTTFSTALSVLIAVMFSIICLFSKDTLVNEVNSLLFAYIPDKYYFKVDHAIDIITITFRSYIEGTCLECIILGTLIFTGCLILQLPYALLAGVIVGLCALVPMFGAFCGGIISFFIILMESPVNALTFMAMFVVVQQIEGNLIYPNVVGRSVGLPPVYIIIAVTLGGNLAGILGMVLFIPLTSSIYQLVKEDVELKSAAKQMENLGTDEYFGDDLFE